MCSLEVSYLPILVGIPVGGEDSQPLATSIHVEQCCRAKCIYYVQDIVLKLVQGHKPPIELEQTPYHALTEATIASEKAKIVQHQLEETIKELQDAVPSTEGTG